MPYVYIPDNPSPSSFYPQPPHYAYQNSAPPPTPPKGNSIDDQLKFWKKMKKWEKTEADEKKKSEPKKEEKKGLTVMQWTSLFTLLTPIIIPLYLFMVSGAIAMSVSILRNILVK